VTTHSVSPYLPLLLVPQLTNSSFCNRHRHQLITTSPRKPCQMTRQRPTHHASSHAMPLHTRLANARNHCRCQRIALQGKQERQISREAHQGAGAVAREHRYGQGPSVHALLVAAVAPRTDRFSKRLFGPAPPKNDGRLLRAVQSRDVPAAGRKAGRSKNSSSSL
jgi:hypothetical protein